jgi:type II secretory pathway pseudopilin PulG
MVGEGRFVGNAMGAGPGTHREFEVEPRSPKKELDARIGGFTLMEILVIIVVLGILAAVVVYAVSGITSRSAQTACQSDGGTVSSAISDLNSEHPGVFVTTASSSGAAAAESLLLASSYGGPYISSWPSNFPHYAFSVSSTGELTIATLPADQVSSTSTFVPYAGPASCPNTIG